MLIRLLCRKTIKKETPNSPMNGGQGVEVSKTLFYTHNAECNKEENKVRRVSFEEYQILKAIYNITIVSASDNEALIFIRK